MQIMDSRTIISRTRNLESEGTIFQLINDCPSFDPNLPCTPIVLSKLIQGRIKLIHYAASFGYTGLIKYSLDKGVSVDDKDSVKKESNQQIERTPLHYAAIGNSVETTEFLLEKEANINSVTIVKVANRVGGRNSFNESCREELRRSY